MTIFKRYIFLLFISLISSPWVMADSFKVTASLDSAELLMGYTTRLRLRIDQPESIKVSFPMLKDAPAQGVIPLFGDSVEMSTKYKLDTIKRPGGRITVNYEMLIQAFDSGSYKLPEFAFVSGSETQKSNSVTLNVLPVKVADDAEISGFSDIAEPEQATLKGPKSAFQKWLEKYWWTILLAAALIAGGIWAWRRYRRVGTLLPVKPVVPPFDEAMKSLEALNARSLWQNGNEKAYYTGLTFILRRYLAKEWNIPAMEMTSGQIMKALKANKDLAPNRDMIRKLLDMADFAKFAKVRPLPEDNILCFSSTEDFIRKAHQRHLDLEQLAQANAESKSRGGGSERNRKKGAGSRGKSKSKSIVSEGGGEKK